MSLIENQHGKIAIKKAQRKPWKPSRKQSGLINKAIKKFTNEDGVCPMITPTKSWKNAFVKYDGILTFWFNTPDKSTHMVKER